MFNNKKAEKPRFLCKTSCFHRLAGYYYIAPYEREIYARNIDWEKAENIVIINPWAQYSRKKTTAAKK